MTFQIPNILGNLGHSEQGMGSLTSGVENLQRVEINRRLQSIQQDKAWERDDRLRNEKLTLEMSSVPTANFVTKFEMDKFAKGKDDYTNFLTERRRLRGGKLTTDDWIEISQKRSELADQTLRGKAFRDSFDKYQSSVISIRSKLKDPEEIAKFDEQQAIFAKKIADPKYEPNPYDAIEALQVPDPSIGVIFQESAKELLPFVDSAVKGGGNGTKVADNDVLLSSIKAKIPADGYIYKSGLGKRWNSPDEMYSKYADYLRPSIGVDPVGWKPDQTPESEKLSGFEGLYQSSVKEGERSPAYVFDKNKYKLKTSFTTPDGNLTNADMTPLAIKENGMVEGEFTVDEKVTSDPMGVGEANLLKIQTGGRLLPADKNGNVSVVYMQPKQYVSEVKMTPDMIEKIKRSDPKAAKYIEDTVDPYPKRTAAEKAGTAKKPTKTVKPKTDPLGLF